MPCNSNTAIFSLCTDASSYSASATSVDVVAKYYGGGISDGNNGIVAPTWDYTMYLQIQDPNTGIYISVASQSGYFKLSTPTKVFSLSGKKQGRYRVYMSYKARENSSYSGSVVTYSFMVYR